ncbi:MAG: hypothetical protein HYV40_00735 [Candidatus Levybacteria bacterium]|nr:hypothetical protein [Candidatus Levybacteria bacterium]
MLDTIRHQWQAKVAIVLFVILTLFWLTLQTDVFKGTSLFDHSVAKFFGAIYGIMALWGAIWGLSIAKHWGGGKSLMGRAILMFSFGLLLQEFGQASLSYIDYVLNIQGAYPSIGDVGFFGSIPFYIYGSFLLAKVSGVQIKLQTIASKIQAVIIPLIMLLIGYYLFLQNYEFDWSDPIRIFLDFGYPFGQAIYVSLAILTYLLSKGVLGGIMKSKVLFILLALVVQFLSDYVFLYQTIQGTWSVGGINDYMYLIAYFLMTLALMQLGTVLAKLRDTK